MKSVSIAMKLVLIGLVVGLFEETTAARLLAPANTCEERGCGDFSCPMSGGGEQLECTADKNCKWKSCSCPTPATDDCIEFVKDIEKNTGCVIATTNDGDCDLVKHRGWFDCDSCEF